MPRRLGDEFRMGLRSPTPGAAPGPLDQVIGTGDGANSRFQLTKTYGDAASQWRRLITHPQAGSVRAAIDGLETAFELESDGWNPAPTSDSDARSSRNRGAPNECGIA